MPQYGKSFTEVKSEEKEALRESDQLYNGMIEDSDSYYQAQIDASRQWAEQQSKLQQEKTDLAISQINQQKEWAQKDYIKEQSGAYTDWQKQANQYGVNAEQQAAQGLSNSGYSESSKTSMYVAYQNRVATAREAKIRADANFDMAIKEAQLQNNSVLAEIAFNALQTELSLALEGFQYKNTLLLDKAAKQKELKSFYYQQWQDVRDQINTENALKEQQRQFNKEMAFSEKQLAENKRQFEENLAFDREQFTWQKAQAAKSSSGGSSGGGSGGKVKKTSSTKTAYEKNQNAVNKGTSGFTGKTYEEAAAYLKKNAGTTGDGGLMTRGEWSRRKAAGSKSAEVAYSSYVDYLKAYCAHVVSESKK